MSFGGFFVGGYFRFLDLHNFWKSSISVNVECDPGIELLVRVLRGVYLHWGNRASSAFVAWRKINSSDPRHTAPYRTLQLPPFLQTRLLFLLFLNKPGIHAIHVYLWRIFRSARAKYIIRSFQPRLLIVMLTSRSSCSEANALEKQRHSDNWFYIRGSTILVTKVWCINRIELKWFMRTIFYRILDPLNLETFDNYTNIETQVSRLWRYRERFCFSELRS